MSDIIKKAKELVETASKKVDKEKVKESAKRAGEIVKDGKISKEEKKELTIMPKDLMKDFQNGKK